MLKGTAVNSYTIAQDTAADEHDDADTPDNPDDYPLQAHNIEAVLADAGYNDYLDQVLSEGERKPECVRRAVRIAADFLHHAHTEHFGGPIESEGQVLPWLRKVIKKHYRLLQGYVKHLAEDRQCRPSTIKNYLLFSNTVIQVFISC